MEYERKEEIKYALKHKKIIKAKIGSAYIALMMIY